MTKNSLTHSPHKPQTLREAIRQVQNENDDLNGSIIIRKVRGGYHALDGDIVYQITKPNGTIVCNCSTFKQTGTCAHLSTLIDTFRLEPSLFQSTSSKEDGGAENSAPGSWTDEQTSSESEAGNILGNGNRKGAKPARPRALKNGTTFSVKNAPGNLTAPGKHSSPSHQDESDELDARNESNAGRGPRQLDAATPLPKSRTAAALEFPFRRDQIKQKAGMDYIDGATVIQRLNDALGTANWSFEIAGKPMKLKDEMVIRGRLKAVIDGEEVIKEDIGAHEFLRKRNGEISSEGDTLKSAVTDCIKRCAHQLGVNLHLYSQDGSYRFFH